MARLFISATHQNVGKTTTSLGLYALFRSLGLRPHFIKPVGQRFVESDAGEVADEDAVLMQVFFDQEMSLANMSPVTIPPGFTSRYVFDRDVEEIYRKIDHAMATIERDVDLTLIEGTGHAGVGSVIDASNADVAAHLNAKAIIIAGAGVGRPIDEICLNKALFDLAGVEVIGAIVNKVNPERRERLEPIVRKGLTNKGIRCLGVMPHNVALTVPTVEQLVEELKLEVIAGHEYLSNKVHQTIVAAMTPPNTISYLRDGTFMITPGDRIDNVLVAVAANLVGKAKQTGQVSGILLSGGIRPDDTMMGLLRDAHVPILLTSEDTYHISAAVDGLVVKIGPKDKDKVRMAAEMIERWVDVGALREALGL